MEKINYSKLDKIFHKIILGNKFVGEFLYDLENFFYKNKYKDLKKEKHIFISGYARSGTTLLLQLFYETKKYSSLNYNDVPFILAPNIWKLFFKKKNIKKSKRSHNDLILIDNNSPEAFEEVFWKMILKNSYIAKNYISKNHFENSEMEKFEYFINQVCLCNNKSLYLSKNNNNVLRFKYILRYFENSLLLIPFRNPIDHAKSLLNQHRLHLKLQNNDQFTDEYMNFLGHHEFGKSHLRFKLFSIQKNSFSIDSINYWLSEWNNYYSYIYENFQSINKRIIILNYDRILNEKYEYLNLLEKKINVTFNKNKKIYNNMIKKNITDTIDEKIYEECKNTETKLLKISLS